MSWLCFLSRSRKLQPESVQKYIIISHFILVIGSFPLQISDSIKMKVGEPRRLKSHSLQSSTILTLLFKYIKCTLICQFGLRPEGQAVISVSSGGQTSTSKKQVNWHSWWPVSDSKAKIPPSYHKAVSMSYYHQKSRIFLVMLRASPF